MKIPTLAAGLILLPAALAAEAAPTEAKDRERDKVLVLEPMKIKGSPLISFAVDIAVYMNPATRKVDRIFIIRVREKTDAEEAGLQIGDEIVKLDGIPVKEFDAVVSAESPLGQILLSRKPGEQLKLEVITRRTEKITLQAQRPTAADYLRSPGD
jgi:membrane-associated protease RseP (regulator of RpoE activity)